MSDVIRIKQQIKLGFAPPTRPLLFGRLLEGFSSLLGIGLRTRLSWWPPPGSPSRSPPAPVWTKAAPCQLCGSAGRSGTSPPASADTCKNKKKIQHNPGKAGMLGRNTLPPACMLLCGRSAAGLPSQPLTLA